jgi:hypothetical protein
VLQDGGVSVPSGSKMLFIKVGGTAAAPSYEYFDYQGTGWNDAFWPASTIKMMAAVAALETLENHGHSANTALRFEEDGGYIGPFLDVMNAAIIPSDNVAYDRLVFLVGFDEINTQFLTPENGYERSVIMRRYGVAGSLRDSPPIALVEDGRETTLPARHGSGTYACANEGNCTNAFELAETVRRIGMHERLADGERFRLTRGDLARLRYALASNPATWAYPGAQAVFPDGGVVVYRKGGLAGGWKIENAFFRDKLTGREYVVTLALPDTATDAKFAEITRVVLAALRAGTITATPVVP